MRKGKVALDLRLREAASPVLDSGEKVEVTLLSQMGIGQWPLLLAAAVVSFMIGVALPDGPWRSVIRAVPFGVAILVWFLVARPHGVVLTNRRVLFLPLTLRNQIKEPPFEVLRADVETRGTLSGWGWLKVMLYREQQSPLRLNVASPWRREAEVLQNMLLREKDRQDPPAE
jgi:hypothetical protein